jgi:hypothetical protein
MSSPFVFGIAPNPLTPVSISGAATTVILDATDATIIVPNFEVNETAGQTGALTVEIYDGTTHFYLGDDGGTTWNAQTVTARKSYKFTGVYPIPKGSKLRVVSVASAGFTVIGTQLPTV